MGRKRFKPAPKRFHPKGLSVIYEDYDILVVNKASGLLSVSNDKVKEATAFYLLNEYVKKGNYKSKNRVYIVHRLDKNTSGVLVFAKGEEIKKILQDEWKSFDKQYLAVLHGHLPEKEGIITSYLAENSIHRMYSVPSPEKGKLSRTKYSVVRESKKFSLVKINLLTGRKNQIRAHFSEAGSPVAGDLVYGKKEKNKGIKRLALHAAIMTIKHPVTKEEMRFEAKVPVYFEMLMSR